MQAKYLIRGISKRDHYPRQKELFLASDSLLSYYIAKATQEKRVSHAFLLSLSPYHLRTLCNLPVIFV